MTIKKLTVAAAIAVGIATCSINSVMAACPCDAPCATPCATPCAAPCATPCPMPCAPNCDCAAPCKIPACATCPSTSCNDFDMKQVYAYPSAIYGENNYVGEQTNAIYSTETAFNLDTCDTLALSRNGVIASNGQLMGAALPYGYGYGFTGAAAPYGYGYGYGLTGSAAPCGCGCNSEQILTGGAAPCGGCGCECGDGVAVSGPCNRGSHRGLPFVTGGAAPCGCLPIITGGAAPCGCNNGCATTIQTSNSTSALKRSLIPFQMTGAAAPCEAPCATPAPAACDCTPLSNAFPDVPSSYWAACPIDKLATNNIVVGYPDRTFKPGRKVSRAEFATMMVKGYNLNCGGLESKSLFKDVPRGNWANPLIAKAVEEGIMCGYPNKKFMPKRPVSRAEALTAMAHGINCDITCERADQILSQYNDGASVPAWAKIPVAKALDSGALKNSLCPNTINPCNEASRAEIADMLQNTRVVIGYDTNPETACDCCPPPAPVVSAACDPCPKTALMPQEDIVQLPILKLKFNDEIDAKSSHVGQRFAATTTEEMTLNGTCYACGSRVNGKIVEVIRPSGCDKGALKVAFTDIQGCNGCKTDLPKQILSAQVNCENNQNIIAKLAAFPFTLAGTLVGTTARTVGGAISNLGNAFEDVSGGVGIAASELLQGGSSNSCACACANGSFFDRFTAAGRSIGDAAVATVMAPIDLTRTALSGTIGLLQTTADEVAYLVDPSGAKISAINPRENVTIAFGCIGR